MSESYPVAILAGGPGTRLGRITEIRPKCLVDIEGDPFIVHQLKLLERAGIRRAIVCVWYLADMVRSVLARRKFGKMNVVCAYEGLTLLGTAGALKKAAPLLGDAFFVLYGDSYLACDYAAVGQAFEDSGKKALMTVFRNENRWVRSNVEFGPYGIVAYDKDKPTARMAHVDYGLGVLSASALAGLGDDEPYDLATLYADLLARGQLAGYEIKRRFYEIGSLEGLNELRRVLSGRNRPSRPRARPQRD